MSNTTATTELILREIHADEFPRAWPIFHAVIANGDTYSYPPDLSMEQAREWWTTPLPLLYRRTGRGSAWLLHAQAQSAGPRRSCGHQCRLHGVAGNTRERYCWQDV
ncbi:hypothetical protein [Dyella caseinilytica]|uniref:hypothetical protein n=1 Tax=Dyella caseinilytica TaxID=1849581 RepID=UPI001EF103D7|nr:hypothetical protein [Dyella caseinilytica]